MNRKSLVFIIAALSATITLVMLAQTSSQFPELDKNGKPVLPRPMPHVVYSPADLAHSGVALAGFHRRRYSQHQHHPRWRCHKNDDLRHLHTEL